MRGQSFAIGDSKVTISNDSIKINASKINVEEGNTPSYDTIKVGKLTDDEMKRFSLGPYSKSKTPGSTSL